jgi:two-component system response regulator RegX3
VADVTRDRRLIMSHIDDSDTIRTECAKLWNNIAPSRQKALMKFVSGGKLQPDLVQLLLQKGLLTEDEQGNLKIFGKLFEDFIRRQQLVYEEPKQGILIDIESGEVYIDGKTIEPLTSLEYRLLLLLYGNIDKICDKYRIVEAVWGEDYIEEVDDARIEKLVSRLRQKIEPNPSEPSYLITVRGRGYRLQNR